MTVTVTPYKETDIGNAFWRDISFSKCDAIPSPYSFKLKGFPKTTTIVSFTIYFSYWGPNNIPPPPSPSLAKKKKKKNGCVCSVRNTFQDLFLNENLGGS